MAATLLNVSSDEMLLNTRSRILEHEGFVVVPAMNIQQVVVACENHDFDAVVLGHSIPPPHKRRIVETVRDSCKHGTPIIGLYVRSTDEADGADHVVSSLNGPEQLIDLMRALFRDVRHRGKL
jgi:DNA-binding response OmpR family regulator